MITVYDNSGNRYKYHILNTEFGFTLTVKAEDIKDNCEYVEIQDDRLCANVGENGYYVLPTVYGNGSYLCRFTKKQDEEIMPRQNKMSFFGVKTERLCAAVIVQGMREEFRLLLGLKNGIYYIYPRFFLNGLKPYEDISYSFYIMNLNDEYADMAKLYRKYQLENRKCVPLKQRAAENKLLEYAVNSVEIRIRMGWKPAPSMVLDQTEENEPQMYTACTFDRVRDIIDELKRSGVDKAEICLVGWNKSGHDGRWPQMFPVEERLGGEKKLIELIKYAQQNGYQIVCHTNSTDMYKIADCWDKDAVMKNKDGSPISGEYFWSGGRGYALCPQRAYEIGCSLLPEVAKLGFKGIHYIDVLSTFYFRPSYDEKYPVNARITSDCYNKLGKLCHTLFGGFASEGVNDFIAQYLDYGLYTERGVFEQKPSGLLDEKIPLWQIVYHGIILSNATTDTVNYPVKRPLMRTVALEYGSRPTFYFYAKFQSDSEADWLGSEDLVCKTDEQLRYSVSKIKEAYDEYKHMKYLQYEFIEDHRKIGEGVYEVTYSDGSVIISDRNNGEIKFKKPKYIQEEQCYE